VVLGVAALLAQPLVEELIWDLVQIWEELEHLEVQDWEQALVLLRLV
jgi:hypothetical protein